MHRFLVAVFALSLSCKSGPPRDPQAMPIVIAKGLDGEYWSTDDALGKVTLVNVWATWCGPCRNELPVLKTLHENFGGPDFQLVGLSIDAEKDAGEVQSMARKFGLEYRIVLDPQKRVSEAWKVSSYPTSVLLDRRGRKLWRRSGEIRAEDEELITAIKKALSAPKEMNSGSEPPPAVEN
jgi:thiol-disulfide isomerase/thioredoxin